MAVRTQLAHRASLKRAVVTYVEGSPVSVWGVVATSLRCLLVVDSFGSDEQQTMTDTAKRHGSLFVMPGADLKPNDVIVMRNRQGGRFTVTAQGQTVPDRHGFAHHEEWKVTEL